MLKKKKLLFFVTEDWYFFSHRLPLALAAKEAGFEVSVITRVQSHGEMIQEAGLNLIPLKLKRRGINPLSELKLIFKLASIYKTVNPDIVHHIALKPVLYGSIAARMAKTHKVVNALAGLGYLFSSDALKARLVRPIFMMLFRLLLNAKGYKMILQNSSDAALLNDNGIVNRLSTVLIRGSGVDVSEFLPQPETVGIPVVILASRLLWDKGVGEFVDAARILKSSGVAGRFALVGEGDVANPSSISVEKLNEWSDEGVIELWGKRYDMPKVFADSHIVCLPSFYGEGVPKVLIEAAACERPIVTTNAPGCRDIVRDNVNGFLVPLRDSAAVAGALKKLLESSELRSKMGKEGRQLVIKEFSLDRVNRETLSLYSEVNDD